MIRRPKIVLDLSYNAKIDIEDSPFLVSHDNKNKIIGVTYLLDSQ
jgi:hypothetical protein